MASTGEGEFEAHVLRRRDRSRHCGAWCDPERDRAIWGPHGVASPRATYVQKCGLQTTRRPPATCATGQEMRRIGSPSRRHQPREP